MSLAFRGFLAVVLFVGFYVLALGIALGLLYAPYAEYVYAGRLHVNLLFMCLVGAGVILWSIIPRRDKFEVPGPRITEQDHPRLFEAIRETARATGQEMPAEVYLVPQMNAFVTERRGLIGMGGTRIMGLGLPLMEALTISELKAVIAHEFGHFAGGDTRFGPWIYRTRDAMERVMGGLHQHSNFLIRAPFVAYIKLFFRVTNAVSRNEEFRADAMSARVAGPAAAVSGLKRMAGVGYAYEHYWQTEVSPVLNAGFHPPLSQGFQRFMQAEVVKTMVEESYKAEMSSKASAYDSHPSTRDRIAAIERLPAAGIPDQSEPAWSLLENPRSVESHVIQDLAGRAQVTLEPVEWPEVAGKVYAPAWKERLQEFRPVLEGLRPETLPELDKKAIKQAVKRWAKTQKEKVELPSEVASELVFGAASAALATALVERGWTIQAEPGEVVALEREGLRIEPFNILGEISEGRKTTEEWRQRVAAAGIEGLDLSTVGREPAVADQAV